jgi:D-glycero-D-manno-heptose 1,7-bisphosphate phosphatase
MKTLFIDRDGVINEKIPDGYVTSWKEFRFLPGAEEAIRDLRHLFDLLLVVTNQQGIGKGLYQEDTLHQIHQKMLEVLASEGAYIDDIFHCPHLASSDCDCRKPRTGMAQQAKLKYPGIDFKNSWMIGDSASDIEFGNVLDMRTALVDAQALRADIDDIIVFPDWKVKSLVDFYEKLNRTTV